MKAISITKLVRNADAIAGDVEGTGTLYRVTRGDRASLVLVSEQYFDGWMAALEEMRRPDWRQNPRSHNARYRRGPRTRSRRGGEGAWA